MSSSESVPQWLEATHRLLLLGNPDATDAQRRLDEWNDHFALMGEDPGVTRVEFYSEAAGSAAAHIFWRLANGPATPVAPGLLLVLCGILGFAYGVGTTYSVISIQGLSGILGLLVGGLLIAETKRTARGTCVRTLWLVVIAAGLASAFDLATQPTVSSDWVAAGGYLLAALSLTPYTAAHRSANTWRPWLGIAFAVMVLAVSNAWGAFQFTDEPTRRVAAGVFVAEFAASIALLHWVRSRRRSPAV